MSDVTFLFDGWAPIWRILLVGTVGYGALITMLRVARQRTLSRMTPFDFVLTVTLGSAFGRVLTAKDVALAEALAAFALLVVLRWTVAYLRSISPAFGRLVNASPALVYHDGQPIQAAMRRHRLTELDLLLAAREQGLGSLEEAYAIVLEPDGGFAVITPQQLGDASALRPVAER